MTGKASAVTRTVRTGDPGSFDILVLDASYKQSLASARSLGRTGLRVAMGECLAEGDQPMLVPAFRSRYSVRNVMLPAITDDGTEFGNAVAGFVREHPTRVVLPSSDAAITALMPWREKLAALGSVLALAPNPVLDIANDKNRTLAVARELGIDYPKTIRIENLEDVPSVAAEIGFPFVLKPVSSWAPQASLRLQPIEVIDKTEAMDVTRVFRDAGAEVIAQEWACGRREGVTLFLVDGEVLASCGHVAYRTSPPLGGASVMRESIPVPYDIGDSAVRLARAVGIEGACEVEFRRAADNRPLLMEINARLAGTIENAINSGVDLPLMIWQWATGLPVQRADSYRNGVRTRWLHGDIKWLRDNQRRVGRPDSVSRSRAVWTFASEFVRTRHLDCFDRRDMRPFFAELQVTATAVRKSRPL
jgi:predicted ATP-grasp superfamily ATP-dependent carboligase